MLSRSRRRPPTVGYQWLTSERSPTIRAMLRPRSPRQSPPLSPSRTRCWCFPRGVTISIAITAQARRRSNSSWRAPEGCSWTVRAPSLSFTAGRAASSPSTARTLPTRTSPSIGTSRSSRPALSPGPTSAASTWSSSASTPARAARRSSRSSSGTPRRCCRSRAARTSTTRPPTRRSGLIAGRGWGQVRFGPI